MKRLFDLLDSSTDAALITSEINRRYFTGFKSSAGIALITRKSAYFLVDFRYIESAEKNVQNFEVIQLENSARQLSDIFESENIKTVAVEGESLTVSELENYKNKFKNIEFETSSLSPAISKLRSVKTETEISDIITAQRIAERAFDEVLNDIKPGKTEREIALRLDYLMQKYGSSGVSFETIVISGAKTSMPHGVPSDKPIKDGELLLFDFGAVYNGYHSDMTRTVAVGDVSEEIKEVYDIVLTAQEKAIAGARNSLKSHEYDAIARDYIASKGYGKNFGHSLGHGVGLEIHEAPFTSPSNSCELKSGMVVTVEPGIYLAGKFGIRIEDMLVIADNSASDITKTPKKLIKI